MYTSGYIAVCLNIIQICFRERFSSDGAFLSVTVVTYRNENCSFFREIKKEFSITFRISAGIFSYLWFRFENFPFRFRDDSICLEFFSKWRWNEMEQTLGIDILIYSLFFSFSFAYLLDTFVEFGMYFLPVEKFSPRFHTTFYSIFE